MRYDLFDYQRKAAVQVVDRLRRGRRDWNEGEHRSAFALDAIMGAGKTVIATAVIESLIFGSSDLGIDQSPEATFLWVTDDPALNRQTLNKMFAASDLLDRSRLVELDNDFLDSELRPGYVYFLNIQKLSRTSGLSRGGVNLRKYSMWDIISNTIDLDDTDLYLILDEAHKGMKQTSDRKSIVSRIIAGPDKAHKAMPIVWGISATIDRFTEAMQGTNHRTTYEPVTVDIERVRASGIVKDKINLEDPVEKAYVASTLLEAAIEATVDFGRRWKDYAESEHDPLVLPVLVIQVNDKPSDAHLADLVGTISRKWPDLDRYAIVNVFGEHADIVVGDRKIRWVAPESIQEEDAIRVVLAKQAISTGWDCPRAEVLYSERAATDETHIAQIIGRMVRTPLARRIVTDDALNSVSCFLPHFNSKALDGIIKKLSDGDNKVTPDVVVNARLFERNKNIPDGVFSFVEELPSLPPPDSLAHPLRRAKQLAMLLADEGAPGGPLLPNAGRELSDMLNSRIDGLAAQYASAVDANVKSLETVDIDTTSLTTDWKKIGSTSRTITTAIRDVDREARKRISFVKEGAAKEYVRYRVEKAGDNADVSRVRTEVAALLMVDRVISEIETAATKWVIGQFSTFNVEIKNTTGAAHDAYIKVREQSSTPEESVIELTSTLKAPTIESNKEDTKELPTFLGHLFSDTDGKFPVKLNDWETQVVNTEIGRPSFVAWYRNPSRSSTSALRIAYQNDSDQWGSLQIDFLVISKRDDGSFAASIVDPHGDHLADAKAKLRGLADYAERFGDRFIRIESIAKTAKGLRSLDLLSESVRDAVRSFEGGKVTTLYESAIADDFK